MRSPRALTVLLLGLLALLGAGCGGGGGTGAAAPDGAALVRADALAFISIDSDLGSSQWQQVDDLSQKFPGRDKALSQVRQAMAKEGVEWDRDVDPALGSELDIVIVSEGTESSTSVVGLTKPDDADKFKTLIRKLNASDDSGDQAVYREVDGWYAVADSQAAIDRVLKGDSEALSDRAAFGAALDELPDETLARAYLDGAQLQAVIRKAVAQSATPFDLSSLGLEELKWVTASASAEDDGLRIHGASNGAGTGGGEYSSKLLGGVPGDAFAFLTFRGQGATDQFRKLESNPAVAQGLRQLERMLGVSFDDVLALLQNEVGLYVRPGAGIPEFTLVLETNDQSAALATLDKLAARIAAVAQTGVQPGQQGGHDVKTVDFGRFAIHYGGLDGKVVVTNGPTGISDYGTSDQRLPDSADFQEAKQAAGMPDSTGGFLYLDLKDAISLIEGFAALAGEALPPDASENLRPLRSFVAWSEGSGDKRSFDAFLEIK